VSQIYLKGSSAFLKEIQKHCFIYGIDFQARNPLFITVHGAISVYLALNLV